VRISLFSCAESDDANRVRAVFGDMLLVELEITGEERDLAEMILSSTRMAAAADAVVRGGFGTPIIGGAREPRGFLTPELRAEIFETSDRIALGLALLPGITPIDDACCISCSIPAIIFCDLGFRPLLNDDGFGSPGGR
jgi:hypothetical protein